MTDNRTGETDDEMVSGMIKGAIGLLALAGVFGFAIHNRNKMLRRENSAHGRKMNELIRKHNLK